MDYATFQASIEKVEEAKKVYLKALAKEKKAREAYTDAKAELKKAEEGYAKALKEAEEMVGPKQAEPKVSTPVE